MRLFFGVSILSPIAMIVMAPFTHGFTDAISALALGCFSEFGTCCRYICASPKGDFDKMVSSLACAIREKAGNLDWGAEVSFLEGSGDHQNIDEEYCFYISSSYEMKCACDPTNPIDNPVRGDTCGGLPPYFKQSIGGRGNFDCCGHQSMYEVEPGWSQIGLPKKNDGCCPERVVSTTIDGNAETIWPKWSCNLVRGYCCYGNDQKSDCRGSSTWKSECKVKNDDVTEDEAQNNEEKPTSGDHVVDKTLFLTLVSVMILTFTQGLAAL